MTRPMASQVSPPNRDKLTMRFKSLKSLGLILSLSKNEALNPTFFCNLRETRLRLMRKSGKSGPLRLLGRPEEQRCPSLWIPVRNLPRGQGAVAAYPEPSKRAA
jgi:hypothetical protein